MSGARGEAAQRFIWQACADQRPASQLFLESIAAANLFLNPLDTGQHWYRKGALSERLTTG